MLRRTASSFAARELTPEYQREIVVRVAAADARADSDAIAKEIRTAIAAAIRVSPRVEFVDANAIYDPATQLKAARLVDLRPGIAGPVAKGAAS